MDARAKNIIYDVFRKSETRQTVKIRKWLSFWRFVAICGLVSGGFLVADLAKAKAERDALRASQMEFLSYVQAELDDYL